MASERDLSGKSHKWAAGSVVLQVIRPQGPSIWVLGMGTQWAVVTGGPIRGELWRPQGGHGTLRDKMCYQYDNAAMNI